MKLLVISLCTQGIMREHFIYYCRGFSGKNDLYCITNDNVTKEELNAIEILNLSFNREYPLGYFSLKKIIAINRFIKKINPDIIYIFTHHATSIPISILVKKYNVIYQVHDPVPHLGVGRINGFIISLQLKIYAKVAKKLVVAGNAVKKQVLDNCTVNESKIEVIPFAVLDNFINDEIKPIEEKIDLLFYGRIEPYKGVDVLIEALDKLKIKPITYIVGKGDILEIYPNVKSIPENVHLLGFVENDELIRYIKACKAIVLPYHEATGTMTVCQAFYYGKPVIASDVGVLPEYVQDGGLIFEHGQPNQLANEIEDLLADEELQAKLSENARNIYEKNFTMRNACEMHQKMFEALIYKS